MSAALSSEIRGRFREYIEEGLKRYAKNLNHLTLPEIKDFNALSDA